MSLKNPEKSSDLTRIYNDAVTAIEILVTAAKSGSSAAREKLLDLADRLRRAAAIYSKGV